MPIDITDVDIFTDPITAPAGADAANAASIVDPVQKLSNRTRHLYNRFDANGDIAYPSTRQVLTYLGAQHGTPESRDDFANFGDWWRTLSGVAQLFFDLTARMPRSSRIVRVRLLVRPGAARSPGNRIQAELRSHQYGVSFGSPSLTHTAEGSEEDDGTTDLQWITLDFSGSPLDVSGAAAWHLRCTAGSDAGVNADDFYAVALELEHDGITNS